MTREFEGKSEREAIEKALQELGLESADFDVEIISNESKKGFLFKRNVVRIRVHVADSSIVTKSSSHNSAEGSHNPEREEKAVTFLQTMIELMGYQSKVETVYDEAGRLVLNIVSPEAAVLIGRKGKNLDALQLLVSVYLNTIFSHSADEERVIVDAENYRHRREEIIQNLAIKNANMASRQKKSRLLEPMNPFERRIVHTTLSQRDDVITQSEGEGLYKQVRIIYRGQNR
ncbi:protein jag [Entomospira nematocerorum]|uniref:RNA-binding protein KhpB n=1 Tax=Entomospira nematocerorum TaxID=2719987 RepID=A0A968GCH5_9SPIO|nr:RNA-binding cell elongation regulator Jag/EloR [Entomospira nematocera]NIZ46898.1 protein jag [Entomospira nematocera]WDI33303.1 protein jag [Entomospira nematocera]